MSKVTIIYYSETQFDIPAEEVVVGTFFVGRIGYHKGLFVVAPDMIVCVDDPEHTWRDLSMVEIDEYCPVDVRIEVKS